MASSLALIYSVFITSVAKDWFIDDALLFTVDNGVCFLPIFRPPPTNTDKGFILSRMFFFGPDDSGG